jgi:Asp-tRNA(Asn)/Glu-tRNA(Gln) amidotransferase A subunit family amidase
LAAALAAGLVLVGTATDGGGSVRIPTSLCGLVGLKPTNGMVGRWPTPDWIDYSTDGPLASSVDDLGLLYDVIIGPVAGDPSTPTQSMARQMVRPDGLPLIIFAAERTSPLGPLPLGVKTAFHEAVDAFTDLFKMRVLWREPESFFADGDPDLDWFTVCAAEHVAALGRS